MANDSTVFGPITPTSAEPLEGAALDDFLQSFIAQITGLPGTSVRPRWQSEAPNYPPGDWCAFGIVGRIPDTYAAVIHHSTGTGYDELRRHRMLAILLSFYGPDADMYAQMFSDGVQISQNHDILTAQGLGLADVGELVTAPSLLKEKWLYRIDLTVRIKQQQVRTYGIDTILSSSIALTTDQPSRTEIINVTGP